MAKNYPREETPVYREQEKPLEKRQAAYGPAPVEKLPPQPFQYEYGVKDDYSGNAFAKTETQNDLGQVQGSYKVNLPDGRIQTVTYRADHEGGFVAEVFSLSENSQNIATFLQVTYEGTPQYPEPPPGGYGPYKVNLSFGQCRNFWCEKRVTYLTSQDPPPYQSYISHIMFPFHPFSSTQGPGAYPGPPPPGSYTRRR